MRTWSFLYLPVKSCASSRTESWDDRSAVIASRFRLPLLALISMSATSPLSLSRETITTEAFSLARPRAVALPIPELPPVIKHPLPVMSTLLSSNRAYQLLGRVGLVRIIFGFLEQEHRPLLLSGFPQRNHRFHYTPDDQEDCD